jgi:hypothetical protein
MQLKEKIVILLAVAGLAACSDGAAPLAPVPAAPETGPAVAARAVAQGIALALANPEIRADVRDAMRASRYTDHKLELREFTATPAGERLLQAASQALGTSHSEFSAALASLPAMDFYAPFRTHRQTWKSTDDIVVTYSGSDEFSSLSGFATDGTQLSFNVRTGTPSRPLLVIHPAEKKTVRLEQASKGAGAVIQDVGEDNIGIALVQDPTQPRANLEPVDCGPDAITPCDGSGDGGSGGFGGGTYSGPTDTTFVDYLQVNYDDGCGSCSVEVELRAKYYENGVQVDARTYRITGVYKFDDYWPHQPLIFRRIQEGSSAYIRIHVVETDTWSDDDKGTRDFYGSDRAQIRSIMKDGTTNVELDWIPKY